jgi:hypothetical protein
MRIFSRKYTAKQKLSRKRILKKRVFTKKIGGSGSSEAAVADEPKLKLEIGSCGKSRFFGRGSCVVLTSGQEHNVSLYLNSELTFYVRYLIKDKKYDTKTPITLNAINYNNIIIDIIEKFGLVEQTNVASVSDDLIAFIELKKSEIHNGTKMLKLIREWSNQGQAASPSPSSLSSLSSSPKSSPSSAAYQERLDECYKLLDTNDFVTYDEKVKTYFDTKKEYGSRIPIRSTDVLSTYKKNQIDKANDCVKSVYNADYKSNIDSMYEKINKYNLGKNIMIDGALRRIDANETDIFLIGLE